MTQFAFRFKKPRSRLRSKRKSTSLSDDKHLPKKGGSAHFRPWFQRRRNSLMQELISIHRSLLLSTSNDALLASAGQHTKDILSLLVRVRRKMLAELGKMKEGVDHELLTQMKRHERFLRSALPSTLAARVEKEFPLPFEEAVQGERR